jgi:hypothetical protein
VAPRLAQSLAQARSMQICEPTGFYKEAPRSAGSLEPRPRAPGRGQPRAPPGSEVRNAAEAPHLRVAAAVPDQPGQGQPVVRPRQCRPTSPGRPHFRPSRRQGRSPGQEASRSAAPSRTEVGGRVLPLQLGQAGCAGPARPRRVGPRPALGPFPWQQRGLRRPTAAKPRCVTSRLYSGSGRGLPRTP